MSGHTPGPWTYDEDASEILSGSEASGWIWIADVAHSVPTGETQANAHLIAAAPDLLEAAKSVIEWDADRPSHFSDRDAPGHAHSRPGVWDDDNGALAGKPCQWCKAWTSLRAAIAKAEGR